MTVDWSHYRLAKEMDISPNSIGNLFRRTTVPSIPTLRHICQVFGISMGEFYSTDGSQTILNKQQKYVLDLYNQLGPSNKIRAESYLEGLADGSYRKKRNKKRERKRQPMILSGCLFLVYFCSCTVHSQTRASVLYCLLSQTDRSLDSQTRATALHRLLSQAVCSLMTQEKQMPPFRRRLFFFCVHHMLTLSAISAILDSFSLVSPLTLE